MKTDREMLDFYGVEVGKRYIVTNIHSSSLEQYKNQKFTVHEDNDYFEGFSIIFDFKKFGSVTRLSCLGQLDYEEIKPEILDEKEKEYLTSVIRPFKDKVREIYKGKSNEDQEYICIRMENDTPIILPNFDKGSMYKGMERNKEYTLKDLKL